MRSLPWHRSVAPILRNNGLATLAESFDKQSHEAPVARTVNTLFQSFRFDDFDMHHQGLAPSKCHACRKRFCNGPWWSVHARGRPIKTPCMEFHQNRCFPKVPAYPRFDSLSLLGYSKLDDSRMDPGWTPDRPNKMSMESRIVFGKHIGLPCFHRMR